MSPFSSHRSMLALLAAASLLAGATVIPTLLARPIEPEPTTRSLPASPYAARRDVPQLTALGRTMFFDAGLSRSGRVSCASCHDPAHAYGPARADGVLPGGGSGAGDRTRAARGFRAVPSLRYLHRLPPFDEHHVDDEGDDGIDMGPTGGHDWDGRADSAHAQARGPLLSADEMGGPTPAAVVERLRRAPYADRFRAAFGEHVFDDDATAFEAASMALEVFQESPADFYPYTSRYDAVLRGQAVLNPSEARGLALFNDPAKGNCASCHLSAPTAEGAFPLFTDFGHIAIGVPRNRRLAANADPGFFDLGLCGPLRADLAGEPTYCGRFRTPSLRNVAVRPSFFHNGVVRRLDEAVRFYATRDTDPARWYRQGRRFDDLPARYHANVNTDQPFGSAVGSQPALSESEIADVVAFLKTLTDADQADADQADAVPDRPARPADRQAPLGRK